MLGTRLTAVRHPGGFRRQAFMGASFSAIVVSMILVTVSASALDSGDYGLVSHARMAAATPPPPNWSSPTTVEAPQGMPSSIACPIPTTCFVVDDSGDVASRASAPKPIDTHSLTSVSCPTANFCLAVDHAGNYLTWTGKGWSAPLAVDSVGLTAVACVAVSFCVATSLRGEVLIYNGTSWSSPRAIRGLVAPDAISCASSSSCAVVSGTGTAAVLFDGAWSDGVGVDVHGLVDVSCPTTTSCYAVDDHGEYVALNGSRWSSPKAIDGDVSFAGVSCTDSGDTVACSAADVEGRLLTLRGDSWTRPHLVDKSGQPVAIACNLSTTCALVDAAGYEYSNERGSWSHARIDRENGYLSQVSCTSPSSCTAVGSNGEVADFDGAAWHSPVQSPQPNLTAVSCVGTFCAMGGGSGDVVTWDGRWSRVVRFGSANVTGIACTSSKFCMAVNSLGQDSTWNGDAWSAATDIDYPYGRGLNAVSCPVDGLCFMTDNAGREIVWRGGRRVVFKLVDYEGDDLTSVDCPTVTECLAVDASGYVVATSFDLATSQLHVDRPRRIDRSGLTSISCGTARYCGAVDTAGHYLSWYQGVWSGPTAVGNLTNLISVSCSPNGLCAALDDRNQVVEGRT